MARSSRRSFSPVFEMLEPRVLLDADDLFTPAIVFDPYGVGSDGGDWTIDDPYFYVTPQASGTAYFIHGGGDGDATIKVYKRSGGGWSLVATESNGDGSTVLAANVTDGTEYKVWLDLHENWAGFNSPSDFSLWASLPSPAKKPVPWTPSGNCTLGGNTLHTITDADYWKYVSPADGEVSVEADMNPNSLFKDTDLFIYSSNGILLESDTGEDDGDCTFDVNQGQTYYFVVRQNVDEEESSITYDLLIDGPQDDNGFLVLAPWQFEAGAMLPVLLAYNDSFTTLWDPNLDYATVRLGPGGSQSTVNLYNAAGTTSLNTDGTSGHSIEFDDGGDDLFEICSDANWWYTIGYIRPVDYNNAAVWVDGNTLPITVTYRWQDWEHDYETHDTSVSTEAYRRTDIPSWDGTGWGYYAGDTHFHSDMTDNDYEFGVPLYPAALIGKNIGLDWFTYTDHSYELDDTYTALPPEMTPWNDPDVYMALFDYTDTPQEHAWQSSDTFVSDLGTPVFALPIRGEEMSVDAGGWTNLPYSQVHMLVYGFDSSDSYIPSCEMDAIFSGTNSSSDLRDLGPILQDLAARSSLDNPAFAYAAHPQAASSFEDNWSGYVWSYAWDYEGCVSALGYTDTWGRQLFRGFEFWNTWSSRTTSSAALHSDRDQSLDLWEDVLDYLMDPADQATQIYHWYLEGGSDDHFGSNMGVVQTVVCAPSITTANILDALYDGRSFVTDGPQFAIGIDRNADGDITDFGTDCMMGESMTMNGPGQGTLRFSWPDQTNTFWGNPTISNVTLYHYNNEGEPDDSPIEPAANSFDVYADWQANAATYGSGWNAYRAEMTITTDAETDDELEWKAYTNPIWIYFEAPPTVSVAATDANASEVGPDAGTFTITRTGSISGPLTVYFNTTGGTAASGTDYASIGTSATIAPGSWSTAVTVNPVNDTVVEGIETVKLNLAANAAYTVGAPSTATVNITDAPLPDLKGTVFPTSIWVGTTGITVSVRNTGTVAAGAFTIQLYVSDDETIDAADSPAGQLAVAGLGALTTAAYAVPLNPIVVPLGDNRVWFGMIVDSGNTVAESNEANNRNLGAGVDRTNAMLLDSHLAAPISTLTPSWNASVTAEWLPADFLITRFIGQYEWIGNYDIDTYTFDAVAGQTYGIDMDSQTAGLDPYIRLYDSSGNLIASNDDGQGPGDGYGAYDSYLQFAAPASGRYYVVCSDYANRDHDPRTLEERSYGQTGQYTLLVSKEYADLVATTLTPAASPTHGDADWSLSVDFAVENQGGGLSLPFTIDFYLASAPTGGVTAHVGSVAVDVGLFTGGSVSGVTNLDLRETVPFLTRNNRYYIRMVADGGGAVVESNEANNALTQVLAFGPEGSLSVPANGKVVNATAINIGQTLTWRDIGLTEWAGGYDFDIYSFTPAARQTVGFDVDDMSGTLDSYIRLYDSRWNLLAANDDGAAAGETLADDSYLQYTFKTDGKPYYLVVSSDQSRKGDPRYFDGRRSGSTGYYHLSLSNITADLTGTSFNVLTDYPATVAGDGEVWNSVGVNFTIQNRGTGAAGPFAVAFYLSDDAAIGPDDILLRTVNVGGLAARQTYDSNTHFEGPCTLTLPDLPPSFRTDNHYTIGMVVDSANAVAEVIENNNSNRGLGLDTDIIAAERHLVSTAGLTSAPTPAQVFGRTTPEPIAFDERLLRSIGEDEWIGQYDIDTYSFQGAAGHTVNIDALPVGGDFDEWVRVFNAATGALVAENVVSFGDPLGHLQIVIPSTGLYCAVVSDSSNEDGGPGSLVDRNGGGTGWYYLTVSDITPDLLATRFRLSREGTFPGPGPTGFDFTVENAGGLAAPATVAGIYLSDDETITAADTLIRTVNIPALAAGETFSSSVNLTLPNPYALGIRDNQYWVGMIVDRDSAVLERDEANNANRGDGLDRLEAAAEQDLASPVGKGGIRPVDAAVGTYFGGIGTDEWIGPYDVDVYSLRLDGGETLGFDIDLTGTLNGLDSYIRLFDATWNRLAANDNGRAPGDGFLFKESYLEYNFTSGGTYYLVVSSMQNRGASPTELRGRSAGSTGTYRLVISDLGT